MLLAGDALSLINPFTGEGIFYAVLSGALAGAARPRSHRTTRPAGTPARCTGGWAATCGTAGGGLAGPPPAVVDAAVRAAGRDHRVFDTMVELGLGDGRLTAATLAQ